tara:strand:- start:299 stop:1525 length:1227 start_codon:yes stop_codon:yes gene_type:complete
MNNYLLNEGYDQSNIFYDKGFGTFIYHGRKKYIDLCCGGGSLLLGYNHPSLTKSFEKVSKKNIANFAAPNKYAVELSRNIKKILPQYSKFVMCNSGAEANIKALRICRAVTKKNLIVMISGSWHGSVDQLLFKNNKSEKLETLSNGLDKNLIKNLVIIPYNDYDKSIKILNKHLNNICCVMCEPIQGGLPDQRGTKYIKKISDYCNKKNIIFYLDEIISGLRFEKGSFQNLQNIKCHISTFGKSFGSGMPIGFIGVSNKILKIIKNNDLKIIFGGTFSANSSSSFIGNEFLKYFLLNRNKIIKKINYITSYFSNELNIFFEKNAIDVRVYHYQSMARIIFTNKKVINRVQRDFLEKNKSDKILKLIKDLKFNGIKYPSNGVLLFNYSMNKSHIDYVIKCLKKTIVKYF